MNRYEIIIRKISGREKREKRVVMIESDIGIDWLAKAIKQVV